MCPHLGVEAQKKRNLIISNDDFGKGTYEIYTCCDDCRQKIQNSLNENGTKSQYFHDMDNNCIRLKFGKISNRCGIAQKICKKKK